MSGPRRLNAFTGFAFVKAPTAAAVRATGSCGASFAAASNCRSAESGRSRPQSAEPYRSFAWASGFAAARASAASSCAGGSFAIARAGAEVEYEVWQGRQTRLAQRRVQEILRLDPVRRVGADLRGRVPRGDRVGVAAGPVVGDPEVELRDCARRMRGRELLHRGEPVLIPGGERRAELRLQRVVTAEDRGRLRQTVCVVERLGARERTRLGARIEAEVEVERRLSGARGRHRAGHRRPLPTRLQQRDPHDGGRGDKRGQRDDDDDAPVCR